jgi:hypothetical protein
MDLRQEYCAMKNKNRLSQEVKSQYIADVICKCLQYTVSTLLMRQPDFFGCHSELWQPLFFSDIQFKSLLVLNE